METLLLLILAVILFFVIKSAFKPIQRERPFAQKKPQADSREFDLLDDENEDIYLREAGETSETVPVQAELILHYKDASGNSSKRLVAIREADIGWEHGYISGVCRLRNAYRTFRVDRIQRAIIPATGEIVPRIQPYLRDLYNASPAASVNKLVRDASDVIRALLYIGKSDGRLTKKEKEIMLKFCQDTAQDERLNMDDLNGIVDYYSVPTKHAYRLICGRISKLPSSIQRQTIEMATAMVSTEKKVDPEETEALEYMNKRFSTPSQPTLNPMPAA